MGGICRFAEQSAVFENYWADCFPHAWAVPTSLYFMIIPTGCSASLSQSYNHSDSTASLRETASSSCLGGTSLYLVIIPTNCSASLSQSYNHSDSAASLRETAASSCLAIIKKVATVSCKHGRLPPFSNLVSSSPALSHAQNRPIGLTRCFAAILLMRRRSFLAQPSEKTCKHVLF